jgi:hypothetical protein
MTVCVLLVAMGLAALSADLKRGVPRMVVNSGATIALLVGMTQLMSNPE